MSNERKWRWASRNTNAYARSVYLVQILMMKGVLDGRGSDVPSGECLSVVVGERRGPWYACDW
jgi:hypothetical protein